MLRRKLRSELRQSRRALSAKQQRQASNNIIKQLYQQIFFLRARKVAIYWPADGEVDLSCLIADSSKTWFLPLISDGLRPWEKQRLLFQPFYPKAQSVFNKYGILEPIASARAEFNAHMFDLVLMPLVGFDRQGNRLGMGKGYYDRTFTQAWRKPKLMGIAHASQESEKLDAQAWDIPLDAIVTEDETIWC